MITYKVEPSGPALADAEEALVWIYEQEPDAALKWYEGLLEAFESLSKLPLRCPLAPEGILFDEEIRQLLYGRYRILYVIDRKTVYILRVRHGSRKHLTPDDD